MMHFQRSVCVLRSVLFILLLPFLAEAQVEVDREVVGPTGAAMRSISGPSAVVDRPSMNVAGSESSDAVVGPFGTGVDSVSSVDPDTGAMIDSQGASTPTMSSDSSSAVSAVTMSAAPVRLTIDRMTFGATYSDTYSPQSGLLLFGPAKVYTLSDGSSWSSGAGSFSSARATFDRVEVSGSTLRYFFLPPAVGFVYQQTDYDSGDHSSNGSLGAAGPLILEAELGSSVGRMVGEVTILSNVPANYEEPRFNYWSAPVGAVAPFEVVFSLIGSRTFDASTFQSNQTIANEGVVDFTASRRPPLEQLEIFGPPQALAGSTTWFSAIAVYEGGSRENVSAAATWSVIPDDIASIDQGNLTLALEGCDGTNLTLGATFTLDGRTQAATKDVVCGNADVDASGESWETYQGDERHSGYVPVSLDPAQFVFRWQREISPGATLNPVTAADGKVFVSTLVYFTGGEALFVLDARDGETLWSRGFGEPFSVNPPAYGYGNVYVQTGDHASDTYLWAFDAETGALVFQSPHAAQWERYYAPTIHEGGVYVNGGYYGGMYAFDAFTGGNRWFAGLSQYDQFTPAVDEQYAYAYVGEYAPALYVFDRETGQAAYQISDPHFDWNGWSMNLAPVVGTQNDVVVIHDGRLIKFDLAARSIGFEIDSDFAGQPSVAKGVIYAISNGSVEARNEMDGSLIWRWTPASGAASEHLIVTDSHVLAHTSNATHALDVGSGQSEWSYPVAGHMALGDDTLYIASNASVTAISMPGFAAAPPTRLEIAGPTRVGESSSTAYIANIHYADGRVRNRTRLSSWSVVPDDSATFDQDGRMTVGELSTPSLAVIVRARYEENGVEVTGELTVELEIAVTLDAFVARNVTAAIAAQQRARDALREAVLRESSAIAVVSEEARRTRRSGGVWQQLLRQLRRARSSTTQADQWTERSISTLEGRSGKPDKRDGNQRND